MKKWRITTAAYCFAFLQPIAGDGGATLMIAVRGDGCYCSQRGFGGDSAVWSLFGKMATRGSAVPIVGFTVAARHGALQNYL